MEEPHKILRRVKQIQLKLEQKGSGFLKEHDLTMVQGRVLRFLSSQTNHCISMKGLEKELNVAQSTSASLVSRLEKKGLVELLQDPQDKRIKLIKMTSNGEELVEFVGKAFQQLEENTFSTFSPVEQAALTQLLEKLDKAL